MAINRDKPDRWKEDIAQSVDMYNDWFIRFAPEAYRVTRVETTKNVEATQTGGNMMPVEAACSQATQCVPTIRESDHRKAFREYANDRGCRTLLLQGDALVVLKELPAASIDCAMTSPPYWRKREYENGGLGLEADYRDYVHDLAEICAGLKRVLKPEGSFWINIGDSYKNKGLIGIPWRAALELTDKQGWILRNSIIWNKVKGGMDNTKDRLGSVHENVFHFVKQAKGYYYNADAIRSKPREGQGGEWSCCHCDGCLWCALQTANRAIDRVE